MIGGVFMLRTAALGTVMFRETSSKQSLSAATLENVAHSTRISQNAPLHSQHYMSPPLSNATRIISLVLFTTTSLHPSQNTDNPKRARHKHEPTTSLGYRVGGLVGFGGGGVPSASLRIWSWRILLPNSLGLDPFVKPVTLFCAPHATRCPLPGIRPGPLLVLSTLIGPLLTCLVIVRPFSAAVFS